MVVPQCHSSWAGKACRISRRGHHLAFHSNYRTCKQNIRTWIRLNPDSREAAVRQHSTTPLQQFFLSFTTQSTGVYHQAAPPGRRSVLHPNGFTIAELASRLTCGGAELLTRQGYVPGMVLQPPLEYTPSTELKGFLQ